MAYDPSVARKAGKSDTEIAEYLGRELGYDISVPRKAGKSDTEIVEYLSKNDRPASVSKEPEAKPVKPGEGGVGIPFAPVNLADTFSIQEMEAAKVAKDPGTPDATNRQILKNKGFAAASADQLGDMPERKKADKAVFDKANAEAKKGEGYTERSRKEVVSDAAIAGKQGLLNVMGGGSWLLDKIPGIDTDGFTAAMLEQSKLEEKNKSAETQASNRRVQRAEGAAETLDALLDDPMSIADMVFQSAPIMLPGMAAGSVAARVAARSAANKALAAGATKEAAKAAAAKAATTAAAIGGVAGEGAISGGMSGAQVESEIKGMDPDSLAEVSARFRALSLQMTPEEARDQLAAEVSLTTAVATGAATVGLGIAANKVLKMAGLGDPYSGAILKRLSATQAGKNILAEVGQEIPQSVGEQVAGNLTNVDDSKAWDEDLDKSAVMGAVGAIGQSGAMQAGGALLRSGGAMPEVPENPAAGGLTPAPTAPSPQAGPVPSAESLQAAADEAARKSQEFAALADEARALGDTALADHYESQSQAAAAAAKQSLDTLQTEHTGLQGIVNRTGITPPALIPEEATRTVDGELLPADGGSPIALPAAAQAQGQLPRPDEQVMVADSQGNVTAMGVNSVNAMRQGAEQARRDAIIDRGDLIVPSDAVPAPGKSRPRPVNPAAAGLSVANKRLPLSADEVAAGQLDSGNRAALGLDAMRDDEELQSVEANQFSAEQATESPFYIKHPQTGEDVPVNSIEDADSKFKALIASTGADFEGGMDVFDAATNQPVANLKTSGKPTKVETADESRARSAEAIGKMATVERVDAKPTSEQEMRRRMAYLRGAIAASSDNEFKATAKAELRELTNKINSLNNADPATVSPETVTAPATAEAGPPAAERVNALGDDNADTIEVDGSLSPEQPAAAPKTGASPTGLRYPNRKLGFEVARTEDGGDPSAWANIALANLQPDDKVTVNGVTMIVKSIGAKAVTFTKPDGKTTRFDVDTPRMEKLVRDVADLLGASHHSSHGRDWVSVLSRDQTFGRTAGVINLQDRGTEATASVDAMNLAARHARLDRAIDQLSDTEVHALYRKMGLAGELLNVDKKREALKQEHPDDTEAAMKAKPEAAKPEVSDNTVFTEDAAEKAREVLRQALRGTRLNTGLDPKVLQAALTLSGYHVERGARTFAAYSQAMIKDLGDEVRPYLKSFYMALKYDPKAAGIAEGMSSEAEVNGAEEAPYPETLDNGYIRFEEAYRRNSVNDLVSEGVPRDVAERLSQKKRYAAPIDAVTGLIEGRRESEDGTTDAEHAVGRAIDYVKKTDGNAFYVSADVANLGGLNAHFNNVAATANKHYRALADIVKSELAKTGATIDGFRTGGDEFGAIVIGSDEPAVAAALSAIRLSAKAYTEANGLADFIHPKHPDDASRRGLGLHMGYAIVSGNLTASEVMEQADLDMDSSKKGVEQNVGREPEGTSSQVVRDDRSGGNRTETSRAPGEVQARGEETQGAPEGQASGEVDPEQEAANKDAPVSQVVLQNRNRSDAAYVQQMTQISANPDATRLGFSRDFSAGAPVILADGIPSSQMGRVDRAATGAGRQIQVQYAVVEADELLASNAADGTKVPGYDTGIAGKSRAVAGNGRVAGIKSAYQKGTADKYREDIAGDEALHGVSASVIRGMKAPILVRIMSPADVTANIGDESNDSGVSQKSAIEHAKDDARRIDVAGLEFGEDGEVTKATMRQFVASMPVSEQTGMLTAGGEPTTQATNRLMGAIFWQAYQSEGLTELFSQATDPEARTVLQGLAIAAPAMARLKDIAGHDLDIRDLITEAAVATVNARRRNIRLSEYINQLDLDASPEIAPILRMFAENIRSSKKIGESLQGAAEYAYDEATRDTSGGMFGDAVPAATRNQVLGKIHDTARQENLGQQGWTGADGGNAQGQAANTRAEGGRAEAEGNQQERLSAPDSRDFSLETQSEADLAAKESREQDEAAVAAAEAARQAEASSDTFGLSTGIATTSEQVRPATRGQGLGLFDQRPTTRGEAKQDLAASPAPAKIADAGESLRWNRKNPWRSGGLKWDDVADKNVTLRMSMAVKSKIWAKPDWEEYLAEVPDDLRDAVTLAARMVKQVYDAIATKPRTEAGVKDYIESVTKAREAAEAFLKDTDAIREFALAMAAKAQARLARRVSILDVIGSTSQTDKKKSQPLFAAMFPESIGQRRFAESEEGMARAIGRKAVAAMQFDIPDVVKAMKDISDNGWPSKREAWQVRGYTVAERDGVFVLRHKRGGSRFTRDVSEHGSEAEAIEAARALVARPQSEAEPRPEAIALDRLTRTGPPRRQAGEDVTPQDLIDVFGFRGINFGNYVPNDERQAHVNHAFDSMLDLAEALDLPPAAMSLGGMLGLAFGAQGNGGKNGAHFVPGVNEINLTRKSGAGALAHEWAHAVDHYFGVLGGLATAKEPFASWLHMFRRTGESSIRPEVKSAFESIVNAMQKSKETIGDARNRIESYRVTSKQNLDAHIARYALDDKVAGNADASAALEQIKNGEPGEYVEKPRRPRQRRAEATNANVLAVAQAAGLDNVELEMLAQAARSYSFAMKEAVDEANLRTVHTGFYRDSKTADRDDKRDYWATNHEMFARAFEAYVLDKLASKDARNDYLVGASIAEGAVAERTLKVYPIGADRKAINDGFDALFGTVQHKQEDGKTLLYSRSGSAWYYSPLTRAVEGLKQETALASQWRAMIEKAPGVKADELAATGVIDWLQAAGGKVKKSDILDFLSGNSVTVRDVMKITEDGELERASKIAAKYGYVVDRDYGEFTFTPEDGDYGDEVDFEDLPAEMQRELGETTGLVRYEQYVLPGGDNYSELLITLPTKPDSSDYKSSHWNEANILAHVRFDERTDADGKRVLFINEIQSDWGQEGKKKGFGRVATGEFVTPPQAPGMPTEPLPVFREGVPSAPFVTKTDAWVSLAIKRMIRHAAENGFDRIAFINGQQAADLYDLSKQIERVTVRPPQWAGAEWTYNAWPKNGGTPISGGVASLEEMEEVIGKEAAKRLADAKPDANGSRELSGIDLKVGGGGMRTFYDKIVPKVAQDVIKKLGGGKLTPIRFGTGSEQLGFDITPAMLDAALAGLPLFAKKNGKAGTTKSDVEKVIAPVIGQWKSGPRIEVVQSVSDLPGGSAPHDVEGAYAGNGVVYLVADNLPTEERILEVLSHEAVGHAAMESMLGADLMAELTREIRAWERRGSKLFVELGQAVDASQPNIKDQPTRRTKEIVALMAERGLHKQGSLWKKVTEAIKAWLRGRGFSGKWVASLPEDMVFQMLRDAERYLKNGNGGPGGPRGSRKNAQASLAYSRRGTAPRGVEEAKSTDAGRDRGSEARRQVDLGEGEGILPSGEVTPGNPLFSRSSPSVVGDAISSLTGGNHQHDSEFHEELRRLREADKTAWSKAKNWWKRNFYAGGLLPEGVFDAKIQRDGAFNAIEHDVRHLTGTLSAMVKKEYGKDLNKLSEADKSLMAEALAGKWPGDAVKLETRSTLLAMRKYIDSLSGEYTKYLADKVAARLAMDPDYDPESDADARLMQTIAGNIGTYVHRSYRAFDDKNWYKNVPAKVVDDAMRYLMDRHIENGMDDAEARRRAEVAINDIIKNGTAYDSMDSFIAEGKLGAKDLSVLIKRKQIAPEIRALLGEYTDPRLNFAKSATKMARLVWNQRLLDRVRDIGVGSFLFDEDTKPAAATVQIAGESSEVYAPLNGLWTTPEVAQAFKDILGKDQMSDLMRHVVAFNAAVKYGKTVLSPTTAMRNIQSALFFTVANGHFDYSKSSKAIEAFKEQVLGKTGDAYMRRMLELSVTYDTPNMDELKQWVEESGYFMANEDASAPRKWLSKLNERVQGFYRFGDDFWKIIGFENEKAALLKAGLPLAEAEARAAERIRNTYPTYSMIGRGTKWLSRFPLVGTFVSFPAEIIRTSGHMFKYMAQDLASGNPELRKMGAKRLVGIALVSGGFYALSALTKAAFDLDDDDEEAIRVMAPEWSKNSTFLYWGRNEKTGLLEYTDLSFLDPYGYWKRPITAMMRDQPWDEALASGLVDMLSPFLSWDITTNTILEVIRNEKAAGSAVYDETARPGTKAGQIGEHLAKSLQPGFVGNAQRLLAASKEEKKSSGHPYVMKDELMALVGWRHSTVDPKTAIRYRAMDYLDKNRIASGSLTRVLRKQNTIDDKDIVNAVSDVVDAKQRVYKDMAAVIKAAIRSGMEDIDVEDLLKAGGVSEDAAISLAEGEMPEITLSMTSLEKAIEAADIAGDDARVDELYRRYDIAEDALEALGAKLEAEAAAGMETTEE